MLINLVPEFLAVLKAGDPLDAYHRYFDAHRSILNAYWNNYVIDPATPHAEDVIIRTITADRRDLVALLERLDVEAVAEEALNTYHYEEFAEAEVARGRSLKGLFPVAGEEAKRDYESWKKAGGKL